MVKCSSSGPVSLLFIMFLLAACAGCATSAPSRFYQLNSWKNDESAKIISRKNSILVAIGPVRIPDYLDRPQIVTRSGENEIRVADFDRWAGSLDQDISRVLSENLSRMLTPESFYVTAWVPAAQPPSYRVEVSITRFEGVLGGSVQAKAQWALFDNKGVLLLEKEFDTNEKVSDNTYGSFVAALSRTLAALSHDIADAISEQINFKAAH